MDSHGGERWAIVLAGGEGTRLRPLTRAIAGDERPKQFCAIVGDETLLDATRRRVALAVPPERTLIVLTRAHERFFTPLRQEAPDRLVVQPGDRGTATGLLYALLRVARAAPHATVTVLPSDHFVSDDARFMRHVEAAFAAVSARPDLIGLLGIAPDRAEVEYGWIEPGPPLEIPGGPAAYRVRRFWEKPSRALAETLLDRGCLWNSFVLVAWVPALLAAFRDATPRLYRDLAAIRDRLGTADEPGAVERLYAHLLPANFSSEVLTPGASGLAVLPVSGVVWSDWGQASRIVETLARLGLRPRWGAAALAAAGCPRGPAA